MHSSSRVRSLAVMSPLAFALAFAASAQDATRVDLHHQDVASMYRQYKAASVRIGMPAGAADRPMPEDFVFAAAVAEWGLLLRDSPYKGSAGYGSALKRAEASAAYDPHGHRAAFLGLLRQTIELGGRTSTR